MSQESNSSDLGDDYLDRMETEAVPAATLKATLYGMRKFNEWLQKRGRSVDLATVKAEVLNGHLRKFYAGSMIKSK